MEVNEYKNYQMQEALNQNQIDAQQSIYAPQIFEQVQQNQAILVEQTDPKKIIKEMMQVLRGFEEQPDGSFLKVSEPKMNDAGLKAMWFILKSNINQNIILSNYDEKEIRNYMGCIQDDLVDCLSLNRKIFGIKSQTDLDDINNSILANIKAALNRAKKGGEKNWLGKISIENISGGSKLPSMKREGVLSKFRL